jgi:hypothetical protein
MRSLLAVIPPALIDQSIVCKELSIAMTDVLKKLSFVVIAVFPYVYTITRFSI